MNKPRIEILALLGDAAAKIRRYPKESLSETNIEELKNLAFLVDECATDFAKAVEPAP